jgi:large subunit ribosomal protein L18
MLEKKEKRNIRHRRVRAKVSGTKEVPRLCVFKSNNHIYAQLIDDEKGYTLASANDEKGEKKSKTERAKDVGQDIAKKAIELKIKKVVFDRGGYKYHGRVKSLAEGAREGGLKF